MPLGQRWFLADLFGPALGAVTGVWSSAGVPSTEGGASRAMRRRSGEGQGQHPALCPCPTGSTAPVRPWAVAFFSITPEGFAEGSLGAAGPISTPSSHQQPAALLRRAQWQSRCHAGHSVGWHISYRGRRGLGGLKPPVMLKTGSFGASEGLPWVPAAAGWWCWWDWAPQRRFGASSSPAPSLRRGAEPCSGAWSQPIHRQSNASFCCCSLFLSGNQLRYVREE